MFFASSVLLAALSAAGIAPERLNNTIDVRIRHGRGAAMLWDDHFPRLLGAATGTAVGRIRRRSGYLLLEFDRHGARYCERGRDDSDFLFPGSMPLSLQVAAIGKRVHEVLDLGVLAPLVGSQIITSQLDAFEGAVAFGLAPGWQQCV